MSILHMGRRQDSANLAGAVSEVASIPGAQNGRVITAVRTADGTLKLISWQVSAAGALSRLGDSGNLAGAATSIDIARGRLFVVACRTAAGTLKLISWNVSVAGAITRRGDSSDQAGNATNIKIASLGTTLFVTACRAEDGHLLLISWRLNANGSLTRLADSAQAAGGIGEVSLVRLPLSGVNERIATSVRASDGTLKVIVWRVSSAGAFTRLGDSGTQAGAATMIRSAVEPVGGHLVTSVRDASGALKLITWGISANGATIQRRGDSGTQAGAIGDNSLVAEPDGVVSAVRTSDGTLKLIGWAVSSTGTITRRTDSAEQAGTAALITIVSVPGAPGSTSMITPVRTAEGTLKLIGWGPACLRLHTKILQQPNVSLNQMVAAMTQIYASVGINVVHASTEVLNLAATFLDIDVGGCFRGTTTAEQDLLFANRNNVGANDVVVYFVRSTVPPFNGCATHPTGRPGAVVAAGATQFTLGHEVGHVLGLNHVNDNDRLMTGNGTANITNLPPDIAASEASTMQSSSLTVAC